ncbi:MAG: carbohydrate ABC transporter permease [Mesoaciditoga sp.]|uniref:carbohydrate ABC transporter permease n=1 Tax=Athalassotoga sp. TaxID=2022597 RepID=UPI000CCA3AE2|nr:MAG: carbohydrate ABC transporter permease [Mesoaciditoga sp.]PMP80087.1 MAG: carbohydrate ABC transporter permease [Mesoaciditoga sp.]HEU24030.1 carbohydrate ABC transporter permease [Mesoaciditoga lauensis]
MIRTILIEALLIFVTIIILLPLFLAVTMSLKKPSEVFVYPPTIFPNSFYIQNYINAFNSINLGRLMLNSLIMSVVIMIGKTIFGILSGYAFSNFRFKGSSLLFALLFVTLFMPAELIMIVPLFQIMQSLHWVNTYWALTVPFLASATTTFLMRQHFMTIPKELEDAAKIDGAGPMRFLLEILIPLSKSTIGGVAVINFVYAWNLYLWPLVVTNSNEMATAQIGLKMLTNVESTSNWGVIMAGTLMVLAPTLILFFAVQKLFVRGIVTTGLKE